MNTARIPRTLRRGILYVASLLLLCALADEPEAKQEASPGAAEATPAIVSERMNAARLLWSPDMLDENHDTLVCRAQCAVTMAEEVLSEGTSSPRNIDE